MSGSGKGIVTFGNGVTSFGDINETDFARVETAWTTALGFTGHIEVLPGTYHAPAVSVTVPSSCEIVGRGMPRLLCGGVPFFDISGTDIALRGLRMIADNQTTKLLVTANEFESLLVECVHFDPSNAKDCVGLSLTSGSALDVTRCVFGPPNRTSQSKGKVALTAKDVWHASLDHNRFWNLGTQEAPSHGAIIGTATTHEEWHWTMIGNTFERILVREGFCCLMLDGCRFTTIVGNIFGRLLGAPACCLRIYGFSGPGAFEAGNNTISGNQFHNVGGIAIDYAKTRDENCVGNSFTLLPPGGVPVRVDSSPNVVVTSNTVGF